MSKLITRRELPLMMAAPFMVQQLLAAQAKPGQLPDPKILTVTLPKDFEIKDNGKTSGNTKVTLYGDPDVDGSLYGVHHKWYPHSSSTPHYHVHDRYVLVLKGTWWIGWGPDYKMDNTYPVGAGTFVKQIAKELHYDGAKDEPCELYIVGIGPATLLQADGKPADYSK